MSCQLLSLDASVVAFVWYTTWFPSWLMRARVDGLSACTPVVDTFARQVVPLPVAAAPATAGHSRTVAAAAVETRNRVRRGMPRLPSGVCQWTLSEQHNDAKASPGRHA